MLAWEMRKQNPLARSKRELEQTPPGECQTERVLKEIAADARHAPEDWLRDAEVPRGGE